MICSRMWLIIGKQKNIKAISKTEYTRMAQDFCSFLRRKNRSIASYVTIFTTQKMGKKTNKLGIFFSGNRLS